jgi:hypothetical protein
MIEGENSSMIYCKTFCESHTVPPPSTTIRKKTQGKNKKERRSNSSRVTMVNNNSLHISKYPGEGILNILTTKKC